MSPCTRNGGFEGMGRGGAAGIGVLVIAVAIANGPAAAQSVLDRPPNLGGTWVSQHGVVDFTFLHRFSAGPEPQRKVGNVPTFLLSFGMPGRSMLGARYATNSQVAPGKPNEWEFFGRINPLAQARGAPADLALHAGWNQAAKSFDGEITAARRFGRLGLMASGRAMSNAFDRDEARMAVAAGAIIGLTPGIALAGDFATLLDRDSAQDAAWSAGLQLRIPYTPHTLSLHISNTNSATLQGSSVGSGDTRFGFEFTVPITLSRYFGRRAAVTSEPEVQATSDTVRIIMQNLAYQTTNLQVSPGTTVIWENRDAVAHTVTSDQGLWDSGLIEGGRTWARTFGQTGTFPYHCTPHPFMRGTIVVR